MPPEDVENRAKAWQDRIGRGSTVVEAQSTIGGGSLPGDTLPSFALQLRPPDGLTPDSLAHALRTAPTPVIGRIENDSLLLDPRTVLPEQEAALINAVTHALSNTSG